MERGYFAHETAVIDDGCSIGEGTRIWHFSHIMTGAVLGRDCNIGQNVVISPGVVLGNNVKVQNNVSVYTGVTCEDDVFLGPSCVFTNVVNPRSAVCRRGEYARTRVGKGATIGANATVVCGHDIGQGQSCQADGMDEQGRLSSGVRSGRHGRMSWNRREISFKRRKSNTNRTQ